MRAAQDRVPVPFRRAAPVDFSNPNDGVDWSRALPPHLVRPAPQPEEHHQSDRTLLFDWPLPENHPSLAPRSVRAPREANHPPSSQTRSQGAVSRRQLVSQRERVLADHWNGVMAPSPSSEGQRQQRASQQSQSGVAISRARQSVTPPRTPAPLARLATPPPQPSRQAANDGAGWELQDFSYESLLELGSLAVSTGLDKKQLARFKAVAFRGPEAVDCVVCLETLCRQDLSIELPCSHVFHPNCILQCLARNNRCPMCRYEIPRKP